MIEVNICIGSACHLKGSYDIIRDLQYIIDEEGLEQKVVLKGAFCLGRCTKAVSLLLDDGEVVSVDRNGARNFFETYVRPKLLIVTERKLG
jgi:NADH:ubiquinone oxidoreductase subunit E